MQIIWKAMFENNTISTLYIIDAHIKNLEFAYMVVGRSQTLLIELGNAYKTKMELLKRIENDSFSRIKNTTETHYSSKINSETTTGEKAVRGSFYEANKKVS